MGRLFLWRSRPYLVKRVVVVPGDMVSIRAGQVSVNGQPLPELKAHTDWNAFRPDTARTLANSVATSALRTDPVEMTVLRDSYFVMGDNRSLGGSLDSRAFGPVDAWDILAQAVLSVWPLPRKACAVPPCDSGPTPE
ncbi:signal peptidase I [Deinococcus arenicola]|uniref:Signal peptidase I n=1 Tax=Deinococcus arenicola TaxID=2994950 RepID=A0ABU4DUR3_9DEIO|nr:signal peptidase I [Deinococcus sp. ZS9-10]MDV6376123.1 signal peptidase I [Deinococcus sp. ZS9-10]